MDYLLRAPLLYSSVSNRTSIYLRNKFGRYLPLVTFWFILCILLMLSSLPPIIVQSDSSIQVLPEPNSDSLDNITIPDIIINWNNTNISIANQSTYGNLSYYNISTYNATWITETRWNGTSWINVTLIPRKPSPSYEDLQQQQQQQHNIDTSNYDLSSYLLTWALFSIFLYSVMIIIRMFRLLRLRTQLSMLGNGSQSIQIRQILQAIRRPGTNEQTRNDLRARLRLAMLNRDFNGDDYELLRQLDDTVDYNYNQHGLDPADINRLPTRTITTQDIQSSQSSSNLTHVIDQIDNVKDQNNANTQNTNNISNNDNQSSMNRHCAICLEPYTVGDTVRTIGCLHQYHKHCIDHWLENHSTCPVCKYDASYHV